MISTPDRQAAVSLIHEAVGAGARKRQACAETGITLRTFERWVRDGEIPSDRRPEAVRPVPANKLSALERTEALRVVNEPRFASLPPAQIVPTLADEGKYLASESSFYRILREENQLEHRGRARTPTRRAVPRHTDTACGAAPLCHRTQSALRLGHHLPAGADRRNVLLPVPHARCVLAQDRGPRGA